MRKTILFTLLAVALLMGMSITAAQDKASLAFGEFVEGEITNKAYEVKYVFKGEKGQIVSIQMLPTPGTYDLDPYLILRDSDGDILAENDDFGYPLALVVAELPANETYTVLATRNGGSTGESVGGFWLRADQVEPVKSGAKLEATITSNSEAETPNFFILRPEKSGPMTIGFSQDVGELFASLKVSTWNVDFGGEETVAELGNTAKVSQASLTVDLAADVFYVLRVDRSFGSFAFDAVDATIQVTVE